MLKLVVAALLVLGLALVESPYSLGQSQAQQTGTGAAAGHSSRARVRSAGPGIQIGIVAATVVVAGAIGGLVVLLGGTGGDDSSGGGGGGGTSTSTQKLKLCRGRRWLQYFDFNWCKATCGVLAAFPYETVERVDPVVVLVVPIDGLGSDAFAHQNQIEL